MKIAVKFSDNDFYRTFEGVMTAISSLFEWAGHTVEGRTYVEFLNDKGKLVKMINDLSYPMYQLYQAQYDCEYSGVDEGDMQDDYDKHIKEWLQITEDNVYLGKEIDEFLASDMQYSVFVVLDTYVHDRSFRVTSIIH